MNELEIKKLWQTTHEKWEESFVIHRKNTEDITRMKVHTLLGSMKPIKLFTLFVGILWVGSGSMILGQIYLYDFSASNKFFLFSATLQVLLTAIALFIYIYQLIKIHEVDISDPILKTQEKLAQLTMSTLWSARVLFLQPPVWTTFWWNQTMLTDWGFLQWTLTVTVTLLFTFVAIWLFFNIKYENRNKKWFKLMFHGKEWTPLMKAMELVEQIEGYKGEKNASN